MIYHRVYNYYFHAVEMLMRRLLETPHNPSSGATKKAIDALPLIREFQRPLKTFIETELSAIVDGDGHVADLEQCEFAEYPMTLLERRWLKAMSLDPRVQLFDIDWSGLGDVEPLYVPTDIVYFDKQNTSDPWTDQTYIRVFRMILHACQNGERLAISWINRNGELDRAVCCPVILEYDHYEDKMRLMAKVEESLITIVLGRIQSCTYYHDTGNGATLLHTDRELPHEDHLHTMQAARENLRKDIDIKMPVLSIQIADSDHTLERTLALFGHYQKKDFRCENEKQYILEIYIDPYDELDDIIDAILSLGPHITLLGPQSIVEALRTRFMQQTWSEESFPNHAF